MHPSTNPFQKTARRSFEGGGSPGSLLLGQDPLAGQYGHASIGAPVDAGAAMDRKMLAQSAASRAPTFSPTSTAAPTNPLLQEEYEGGGPVAAPSPAKPPGMQFFGPTDQTAPTLAFENGGAVSPLSLKGIGRSMGFFQTPAEKQAAAVAKIDAEQAAYRQRTAQAAPAPAAPRPNASPSYTGNTSLNSRMGAEAALRNGGKIKGPGTGTSDSIPARVEGSGEPIRVANGERIVSVDQDKLLQRIAKARGYDSIDHMFEAETGKPVGPVLKGGKLAAAGGLPPDDLEKRIKRIPAGGAAPAPDGRIIGNDLTRNVNNSLNALGGMGVVSSVPLKAAQAGQSLVRSAGQVPAVIAPAVRNTNVALQEGALANQAAAATRSFGNASAWLGMKDSQQQSAAGQAATAQAAPGKTPMELHQEKVASAEAQSAATAARPRRGEYSALNEAEYLAANDKANALKPSYFSQTTPTSAQNLAQADQAATAALHAIDSGKGSLLTGARPATAAQQPAGTPAQPAAPGTGDSSAIAASEAASRNASRNATELKDEFSNASTLARNPGGAVRKTVDANGKTSYSGGNVTGDIALVGADGAPLPGRARGGLSIMGSGADTSNLNNPDGTKWSAGDNAIMAANIRDGVDPLRGTSREQKPDQMAQMYAQIMNTPMSKEKRASMVQALQVQAQAISQKAQTSSQEKQNSAQEKRYAQTNDIEREKLGLAKEDHVFKQDQVKQLAAAQAAYLAAPDGSPEQKAAERKLVVLGGKQAKAGKFAYAPGGQVMVDGQLTNQPGVIYDTETGQPVHAQAGQPIHADPRAIAIRDNKSMTREQKIAELKKIGFQ